MYIVKYKNDILYMNGSNDYTATEARLTLAENSAGSLKLTTPKPLNVPMLQPFVDVYHNTTLVWRGRMLTAGLNFYNEVEYTAEGMLAVLNDTQLSPYEYAGTVEGLLAYILDEHNRAVRLFAKNDSPVWEPDRWYVLDYGQYVLLETETQFNEQISLHANIYEVVDSSKQIQLGYVSPELDPNNYINRSWEDYTSAWEIVKTRLLDEVGGYLSVRYVQEVCYLDYLTADDVKQACRQQVLLAENLIDLTQSSDATTLYTAIIPRGAEIKNKIWEQWSWEAEEGIEVEDPVWEEGKWYVGAGSDKTLLEGTSGENTFNSLVNSHGDLYTLQSEEPTGQRISIIDEEDATRNPPKYRGQEYLLASQEQLDRYGLVFAPIADTTWDNVTLPINLMAKAKSYLDNQTARIADSIDLTFADLSKLGVDTDEVELYSEVRVTSAYHDIDRSFMVVNLELDLTEPETSQIKVGDTRLSMTAKTVARDRDVAVISGRVEMVERDKADLEKVEAEVTNINKTIENTANGLTLQIQAVDTKADSISERTTTLETTSDGIELEISRLSTDRDSVGWLAEQVATNFGFSADGLTIGKNNSQTKMELTNDSLSFKVNDIETAVFKPNVLEVRNVEVDNELGFGDGKWAIRENTNGNLDDMWLGGEI